MPKSDFDAALDRLYAPATDRDIAYVAAELRLLAELPVTDGAARDTANRLLLLVRHKIDPLPGLTTQGRYVERVVPEKLPPLPDRVVTYDHRRPDQGPHLETDESRGTLPTERVDQLAEAHSADVKRHKTCGAIINLLDEARKGRDVDCAQLVALADALEGRETADEGGESPTPDARPEHGGGGPPGEQGERSAPMSKTELAKRILHRSKTKPSSTAALHAFAKYDLQAEGKLWTVRTDTMDGAMRARVERKADDPDALA